VTQLGVVLLGVITGRAVIDWLPRHGRTKRRVMMLNKVIVVGRLAKDPELRHTATSKAVCNFSLGCEEVYQGKRYVEWINVVAWGKTAENVVKYLSKGRLVYVDGRMQTQSYEKDGQRHWKTQVVAANVKFLDGGSGSVWEAAGDAPRAEEEDDSLPF
jgi:single-strand DNA-binding protein